MITVDFESQAIGLRPRNFPPKSVGVAIDMGDGSAPFYAAWGHPTDNNSTWEKGKTALANIWDKPLLFHNGGGFDIQLAMEEFGLDWPAQWDDTLYMRYLTDPHARSLSLKPSVEQLLGVVPVERDALRAWVLANVPGATVKGWGAHIGRAPGSLVGQYASADVTQTRLLYNHLWPQVVKGGMVEPYEREKKLAPILHRAERRGVRCDLERLEADAFFHRRLLELLDNRIRVELKCPELNIDSNDELADALERAGLVTEWVATPTGKRSTSAKNMAIALHGNPLTGLLRYRAALATCVGTFMEPWIRFASADGRVFPSWNQVRGPDGGGTRTGRLSCQDPNLMNVPKEFEDAPPEGLPPLPLMRSYLLPELGEVWGRRDYSQQELRILAHYEDGDMLAEYGRNPNVDFHALAAQLIERNTGMVLSRKHTKTTAFSILYGSGAANMAEKLGCTPQEAQGLKNAYYEAIPGIRFLQKELKQRARVDEPLRTWGGRLYYCEPPTVNKKTGQQQTYEYKLLNYLIQGSASDCTKQGVINYDAAAKHGTFLVQVHDEVNISVHPDALREEMEILSAAMADVAFDVPMLSDGSAGPTYQDQEKL